MVVLLVACKHVRQVDGILCPKGKPRHRILHLLVEEKPQEFKEG